MSIVIPEHASLYDGEGKPKPEAEMSALELFVFHNEPAGNEDEKQFRDQLQAMLDEVVAEALQKSKSPDWVWHCGPRC